MIQQAKVDSCQILEIQNKKVQVNRMSKIVLTRVDSRLIHGQVVTKWLQQSGANEILVVSDELEQDEFYKVFI